MPLVRTLNNVLFKIISEKPHIIDENVAESVRDSKKQVPESAASGLWKFWPFSTADDSKAAAPSSSRGNAYFDRVNASNQVLSLSGLRLSDDDFDPNILRLFRFSFTRSAAIVLSDLYTRWSRRPFSDPSLWILPESDTLSLLKSLQIDPAGFASTAASIPENSKGHVGLSLLKIMPWSISFVERLKFFRQQLDREKYQIQGTNDSIALSMGAFRSRGTIVKVRRSYVVEDGIRAFEMVQGAIKDRIVVQYINDMGEIEAGIDAGGLFKDLLTDLSARIFNPSYGLFSVTSDNLLYPNPTSTELFGNEVEELYTFVGKLLGKAIFENITIQPEFSHFFLSFLNGKYDFTHLLDDLKSLDPELHKNLLFLKTYEVCFVTLIFFQLFTHHLIIIFFTFLSQ